MEFKSFGEIKHLNKIGSMTITQKIHGTNAQICIYEAEPGRFELIAGSRTRWIYPEDDNHGFAAWAEKNKGELISKLGVGTHYGEWAGPGINSGEGLTERRFILFGFNRYTKNEAGDYTLPPQTVVVPVLYEGPIDLSKVQEVMEDLKTNGSRLVPGFMRPEGVVVSLSGSRFKAVFAAEETQWKGPDKVKNSTPKEPAIDYNYLCQPIRLEKLLSRDESYIRDFPKSLSTIVKDYVADLIKEEQITGDESRIKAITKGASSQIFKFVKEILEKV